MCKSIKWTERTTRVYRNKILLWNYCTCTNGQLSWCSTQPTSANSSVKVPESLLAQQSGDNLCAWNNGCPQPDSLSNHRFFQPPMGFFLHEQCASHQDYSWGSSDSALLPKYSGLCHENSHHATFTPGCSSQFPLEPLSQTFISLCSAETSFWHFHALNREYPDQLPHVFLAVLALSFYFKCENRMPWQNCSTSQAQVCSLPP